MGSYHAKHLSRNPYAELVGIVDAAASRSQASARAARTQAFTDLSQVIGTIDAAVIATPTPTHHAIGKTLLEAGVSCLIEKPLAAHLHEAEELIELAKKKGKVLQVGHIERFNPAVTEAAKHIRAPQFIEVNRLGPYDPRVADIGVVLDLMIHDLDIVQFLVGEPVVRVEAFGAKVLSNHEDIAKVRLHFANGCIADLSASRVSLTRYRRIRIFQKDAYLSLDYAAPALKVYRKKNPVVKSLRDIQVLNPKLPKQDALALEIDHFLTCVREGKDPLVTGVHGRDALQLAGEVLRNLKVHA
jgi:predicted dehydrogenase